MPSLRLLTALVVSLLLPASALAAPGTGGVEAPSNAQQGGVGTGATETRPVAALFTVTPQRLVSGDRPVLWFRIAQPGTQTVRANIVVRRRGSRRPAVRIALGDVPVGRVVRVPWPRRTGLKAGRYVARVDAVDAQGSGLARAAQTSGRTSIVVSPKAGEEPEPRPRTKPKPRPRPAPKPAPRPKPTPSRRGGSFPVRGSWTFGGSGGRFGAGRPGRTHEGQDISAPSGSPVVSPLAGTVAFVDYQKAGAGWYVVVNTDDGRSLFFAHLQTGSVVVKPGARVRAGSTLARVGSTGASSGPHLHFEIWNGGWRDRAGRPVDPLPQLQAWAR